MSLPVRLRDRPKRNRATGAPPGPTWWDWLDQTYTVKFAYEFRNASDLVDAVKFGSPLLHVSGDATVTLTADGWVKNHNGYWNTQIAAAHNDTVMLLLKDGMVDAGTYYTIGARTLSNERYYISANHGNQILWGMNGTTTSSPRLTDGTVGMAYPNGYRNGVSEVTLPGASFAETRPLYMFSENPPNAPWEGTLQAAVLLDDTLNATQMAELHTVLTTGTPP